MENGIEGFNKRFQRFFMKLMSTGLGYRMLPVTCIH